MRFFFYGTLLDPDVMATVIRRRLPPSAYVPAMLPGYARRRVKGGSYPIVLRDRRSVVHGAVVAGLSPRDVACLAACEGPGYRIGSRSVQVAARPLRAHVFEPVVERFEPTAGRWDLVAWQRTSKKKFLERVRRAFSAHPGYSTP